MSKTLLPLDFQQLLCIMVSADVICGFKILPENNVIDNARKEIEVLEGFIKQSIIKN